MAVSVTDSSAAGAARRQWPSAAGGYPATRETRGRRRLDGPTGREGRTADCRTRTGHLAFACIRECVCVEVRVYAAVCARVSAAAFGTFAWSRGTLRLRIDRTTNASRMQYAGVSLYDDDYMRVCVFAYVYAWDERGRSRTSLWDHPQGLRPRLSPWRTRSNTMPTTIGE